ncbi:MAG: hypothetical protein WC712_00295 [Candidatus Brocadiia bacterium]
MKLLRIFSVALVAGMLASSLTVYAEEPGPIEGWTREKLSLVVAKDTNEYMTAATQFMPLFYGGASPHWLDDMAKDAREKNFNQEVIGPPTRSEKYRGVLVVREGSGINIDTDGDDRPDTKLAKTDIAKVKCIYRNGDVDRNGEIGILFKIVLDENTQKPHWSYSRGYYVTGRLAGTSISFFDENADGFFNVTASDGMVIGNKEKYGCYLSSIVLAGGKLYDLMIDDQGRWFDYRPIPAATTTGKIDFVKKFKGPMKPLFVVLRTPFDKGKPDPRSVSIFLPKGVGIAPEGLYDFKWTMMDERCQGRSEPRPDQWIDNESAAPYFLEKNGQKNRPPFKAQPISVKASADNVVEWGAPFAVHARPVHNTNDGGAKVDYLSLYAGDFMFFDSKLGICFWTPLEYKKEGAALPEDLMFDIMVYNPKGELMSRNTRYVKGAGGGTGDADPNWQNFNINLSGQRGIFKIEIKSPKATAHFGEIHCYNDFEIK